MTLLRELIDIPDQVHKGDFVLRLAEDIGRPEVVLDNYVVTQDLARHFDQALSLIKSAVQKSTSQATYLHGSFGSGKSHFMAVLHLILQGNPSARSIPELAPVIQKHNDWLAGKKFLLVPYHMIGAHDMESGVLGGYVQFMRHAHPDAPIPPVYISAAIIQQAQAERASYGDEAFFRRLNAGQSSGGGWGDLDAPWDAASFDQAAGSPPDSEPHLRLVSTLLRTVASSHVEVISHRGGNFVRFDQGLSLISSHAQELGYDALILFLDELILWLATKSADLAFVKNESAKLTNLKEAQAANRPVPIISFVARQRDLRELIGDHVPGAERLSFSDSLDWQQGRFDTITLEDRNLPAIAEKRVLRCRSAAARAELDAAFEQTVRMKDSVMNILLTQDGDRQMFRKLYPFSPALVQTLIAVSSVLQRERTALKVMMQLLVDHRDTLQLGEIIPVGDLFDVVAHGDEAFSQEMAIHFDNAKRLYHQKLLPVMEKQHGIRREEVEQLDYNDPKRTAFRNDDRLIKTLLLSALVPEVESLRGLNAEKLAALNHGTIKSPIPGKESATVLNRCRNWAASVGEIRIGEEANPTITVQLSGVDTEGIIAQAGREDNQGNRIRRIRQMLFELLEVGGEGDFEQYHEFLWKNTKRSCKVLFKNIRELPFSSLDNDDTDWKLIVDFPFDEPGHGPRDDLSTIQRYLQAHPAGAKTLCWVPSFFSSESQKELGTLVILEHILTGERFGQYADHLSPQDRQSAKSVLESQRNQLRQRVKNHLDAAYGVDSTTPGALDTTHDLDLNEHYVSLIPGLTPLPPVAANLAGAMQHLLSQALLHEFPAAPDFGAEVRANSVKKVLEQLLPGVQAGLDRIEVEKTQRQLVRQIADPLRLGEMGVDATHFVVGQFWKTHFGKKAAETGSAMTVAQLRRWIDDPKPMGLPKEAQNMVIIMFAAQTGHSVYLHGSPFEPTLSSIPDACELRKDKLPDPAVWEIALKRAGSIFGVAGSRLLSSGNVNTLATECRRRASDVRRSCQAYAKGLRDRFGELGIPAADAQRLATADSTLALVERLVAAEPKDIVNLLASATVQTSETAMGECVAKAAELEGNLDTAGWQTFELIRTLPAERQGDAQTILADLKQALISDEHVLQLAPALKLAQAKAMRLLQSVIVVPPKVVPATNTDDPKIGGSNAAGSDQIIVGGPWEAGVVDGGTLTDLDLNRATQEIDNLKRKLRGSQTVRITISWEIRDGGRS
ncbi:MAG: hypothetical protein U0795_14485 [Pirellulales bacterium]